MDNKLFSFRMIQEQLRKSKRYKYTHMYTFLQSMYIPSLGGGGGGGDDETSDIEKQGRSKSNGLQKVMVVAKYMYM